MKLITTTKVARYIAEHGGDVWVWLDPRRGMVGSYVWLETHTEPPGATRETKFTRSSRRPHAFRTLESDGLRLHYDFGRLDPPDELLLELRGWANKRVEAYWNGCVFVGDQPLPLPGLGRRSQDST
jgi:hypothetical protein